MIVDVKIPLLPESVPDATLLDWAIAPGQAVNKDDVLVELETDKVVLEVSAPESGVITEIVKATGETGVSDEIIARIDTSAAAEAAPGTPAAQPSPAPAPTSPAPVAQAADAEALSPAVRKLVDDHGLDAASIAGSGPGGRLTKGDVLAHIKAKGQQLLRLLRQRQRLHRPRACTRTCGASARRPGSRARGGRRARRAARADDGLRQRIAERLVQAQHTAAILTTFNEVNMEPVMSLRKRLRDDFEKAHDVRLGFMSFFAKAAVQALQEFPAVNAYIEGNEIVYHDYCDIGVAVSSPRGLVVPILRNVENMNFAQVEGAIADFGQRAQNGSLGIEELSGGTFTISNGGVFGSMLSTPY